MGCEKRYDCMISYLTSHISHLIFFMLSAVVYDSDCA
jgi:hypothetical protein